MKKGMVYKIELQDEIYIGSTETQLCQRQSRHNYDLKKNPNLKLYKKCIEQGIDKIKCIWVADIEFNSTAEKRMKEEQYRKELNATLNSQRCYTTENEKKEYQIEYQKKYREIYKQEKKEYYEKNKDILNAKRQEKIECPNCKSIINRGNLARHQKSKKCI